MICTFCGQNCQVEGGENNQPVFPVHNLTYHGRSTDTMCRGSRTDAYADMTAMTVKQLAARLTEIAKDPRFADLPVYFKHKVGPRTVKRIPVRYGYGGCFTIQGQHMVELCGPSVKGGKHTDHVISSNN
jgi:hypothetical protein